MSPDIGIYICAVIIGAFPGIRATDFQVGETECEHDLDSTSPMHLCLSEHSSPLPARLPTSFFCRNHTPVSIVYDTFMCQICNMTLGLNTSMSANSTTTKKLCWLPVSLHLLLVSWVFTALTVKKPSAVLHKTS